MSVGERMEGVLHYLATIRADWRRTIGGAGGKCPCCDRWGRVNKKALNKTMVRGVYWMAQQRGDAEGWIHMPSTAPKWMLQSNQYSALRGWGFIERRPHRGETDTKYEGYWRVTALGHDFADGKASVRKSVLHYNQEYIGTTGPEVYIGDVTNNFSYSETMS